MHGLHNSFSESWHLFILELAPVETENSLECSQQACPLHIPKHTELIQTQFAAILALEVGSSAHWPRIPPQNTNPSSSAPSPPPTNTSVPSAAFLLLLLHSPALTQKYRSWQNRQDKLRIQQKQLQPSINHSWWGDSEQQLLSGNSHCVAQVSTFPVGQGRYSLCHTLPGGTFAALEFPRAVSQEHTLQVLPLKWTHLYCRSCIVIKFLVMHKNIFPCIPLGWTQSATRVTLRLPKICLAPLQQYKPDV